MRGVDLPSAGDGAAWSACLPAGQVSESLRAHGEADRLPPVATDGLRPIGDVTEVSASQMRLILPVTILSVLYLWLVSGQTLRALGGALHDDQLFLSLAQYIAGGHWLGPFGNLTLAKGPFYPMWIAASFILGVPLQISQYFLYIAACVVTILALRPVVPSKAALVAIYAVLLFNPAMFGVNRVLRECVYIQLTLLLAACLIGLFVRRTRSWGSLAAWAGAAGLALGGLWLTREETIWILPSVLFIVAASAFLEWRRGAARLWQRWLLLFSPLAILGVALALVSGINLYYYGAFIVTEVAASDWLAAYGALLRVEHDTPQRYVVVPRHVRERIYRVSPAFAELRSAIEGQLGRDWMTHGCKMMPETCGDITAGWFMWLLRDAVSGAGHYRSAPMALGYYRRLAREVNAACDAGTLRCGPPRATMMPPWRREYGPLVLRSMMAGTTQVVRFQGISAFSTLTSHGDEAELLPFRLMTRDRLAPSSDGGRLRVDGWGFSPDGEILISVRDSQGTPVDAILSHLTGRDVFDHFVSTEGRQFDRALDARFILWTSCLRNCTLVVKARGRVLGTLPLDGSVRGLATPELRFHLDRITSPDPGGLAPYPVDAFKLKTESVIIWLYRQVGPILAGILIIGLARALIALAFGYRVPLLVPLLMLVGAFFARIGLVALIDSTSFPARTSYHYLSPAHALFMLAGLLACVQMGRSLETRWRRQGGAATEPIRDHRSRRRVLLAVSLSSGVILLAVLAIWYVWPSRELSPPGRTASVCCKDINGDGKVDILWRQPSGAVAVWLLSGTNVIGTGVLPEGAPADWTIVGVGDVNGDGKADILWRQPSGVVGVWLLNGASVIGTGVLPGGAPGDWKIAGVGDFNGDGKADILWRQSSGAVAVWLLDGASVIGTGVLPGEAPADWTIVGVGDFNGDGQADILWRQSSGAVAVWLVNGMKLIGTGGFSLATTDWIVAGVGDFNGDGKADILWRQSSGAVAVWLLNGAKLIGAAVLPGGDLTDSTIVGVGDVDGDGKADILWRQPSGAVAVWLMDGTSVAGTGVLSGAASKEWRVQ